MIAYMSSDDSSAVPPVRILAPRARDRDRPRITSKPNPDGLERGCDRMWDQIEDLLDRREALMGLGEQRTAREEEELTAIWPEIQTLRAYSAFYREILRWETNLKAGHKMPPRFFFSNT